jgi:hypothetical protein
MRTNAMKDLFIKVMVVKALIEISENDKYKEFILRGKLIGFEEVKYVLLKNVISVMKIMTENKNEKEGINSRVVSQIVRDDLKIRMHRTNKGFAMILNAEAEKAKLGQVLNLWRGESMSDLENLRKLLVLLEQADEIIHDLDDELFQELKVDLKNPTYRVRAELRKVEKVKLEIIQNTWDEKSYHL